MQELPPVDLCRPAGHGAVRHCGEQVRLHRDTQACQRPGPQDRPPEGMRALTSFFTILGDMPFSTIVISIDARDNPAFFPVSDRDTRYGIRPIWDAVESS